MGKSMVMTLFILVVSLSLFNFHVSSAKRTILIGDRRMLPSCTDCRRYTSDPTCCHLPHHPNLSPLMEDHFSPDEKSVEEQFSQDEGSVEEPFSTEYEKSFERDEKSVDARISKACVECMSYTHNPYCCYRPPHSLSTEHLSADEKSA
ncbi:hypothetical protein SUGI_0322980 [Cryptomeria japonica]|nr:hypothetical protein SUGI_0322980 [Cryptomeria japonica]